MKIILTTHGKLATGILDSYRMIAGNTNNILPVELTEDGISDYRERLIPLLDEMLNNNQILVLCDLKGGTPYNECYRYYLENEDKIRIVTGVNLPMLIEVGFNLEHKTLEELETLAVNSGNSGIETLGDLLSLDNDDNIF